MEDEERRQRWRGRARLLVGAAGLLFAAVVVCEKQRLWERSQPVALGEEDYARELRGDSPAQRLSALQRSLERATVRLQGSDRSRSRAIRREETLAERPRASTGFEQGASAEWAAGGATALAQHVRSEFEANNLLGGDPGPSSSVDSVLARSGRLLQRDIERQERSALGQGLVNAAPAAAAAPQPAAAQAAADAWGRLGSAAQARPQQLSQVWQGTGAVYAPSVMTPYQQQMLQSFMGAATIPSPPAVQSETPTLHLQGGSTPQQQPWSDAPPPGLAPSPELHGPALAAAWKAYLDPESATAQGPAAAAPASVSAPVLAATRSSEVPTFDKAVEHMSGVGKAVENVALDSDGVLQHAESLMSSVKKLLKKPEHDIAQAAASAREAVEAAKESKKLTQGEMESIAEEYKKLARSIATPHTAAQPAKTNTWKKKAKEVVSEGGGAPALLKSVVAALTGASVPKDATKQQLEQANILKSPFSGDVPQGNILVH